MSHPNALAYNAVAKPYRPKRAIVAWTGWCLLFVLRAITWPIYRLLWQRHEIRTIVNNCAFVGGHGENLRGGIPSDAAMRLHNNANVHFENVFVENHSGAPFVEAVGNRVYLRNVKLSPIDFEDVKQSYGKVQASITLPS